jgi:methylphosphotriester-DNA--protein-cysteine methyltransferase
MKTEKAVADAVGELRLSSKFRDWRPALVVGLIKPDEKHYQPSELAEAWGVSVQTVREIFKEESGVLKIGRDGTRLRRGYKTLRIPESVAQRVHERLSA